MFTNKFTNFLMKQVLEFGVREPDTQTLMNLALRWSLQAAGLFCD